MKWRKPDAASHASSLKVFYASDAADVKWFGTRKVDYIIMLITRIELENIKSYQHVIVDFRRGTTAISGANGAGKTTLVEAVGFALFGYLPYSHDQFVREGEKHGKVVVSLIGSDERPYTVERRCGSGARWLIYDQEADLRLEQRADVLDRLHDLFGIDRERPLDSLFRDALGVPQGTFTAIFLEPAGKRKQTFDALLQIEDYKTAADNLLETQKYHKEQMGIQQNEIQRLTFATSELAQFREQLKDARLLDEEQKARNAAWSQQLTGHEARLAQLNTQQEQLAALEQRYRAYQQDYTHALNLLHNNEQQWQTALMAQRAVAESQADYQRYLQAQEVLQGLRQDALQRDKLRQQQAQLQNECTKIETQARSWQGRLAEVASARQKVVALAPLVDQQVDLEKKRDEATRQLAQYGSIVTEGKRLSSALAKCLQDQEKYQRRITEIEPLVPIAERLQEHNDALMHLRIQVNERSNKLQQWQEKRNQLHERQLERDQCAEKLRKAENSVTTIEEHRREAEEMPLLQEQYNEFAAQQHRLEGNISGYVKSRAQSAGGQCPLLYESCLNIKQRGIASLESYFDGLLQEEHAQMALMQQQQETVTQRMGQIKKYADALNKIGQYIERRDTFAEQLQRLAIEITRLERDVTVLADDLEALKTVEQKVKEAETAYRESKQADTKVRELEGLRKQILQLQEQAQQLEANVQARRLEATALQGSAAQLKQVDAELATLNDPRSASKTQQAIIAQEEYYQQQLEMEQQRQQAVLQKIQLLDAQLAVFSELDDAIAHQDTIMHACHASYQRYLQNEQEAHNLPERERVYQQQLHTTEQAQLQLQELEHAYTAASTVFDRQELATLRVEVERLRRELTTLAERMQHHQGYINTLEQQIARGEALLLELEAVQQEHQTLEDLYVMTEQFRKLIKDAAPHVLKAILADISAEANRIFGEVMGDRSAQLSWRNDYEIVLRRQGVDRSFAQLSGGEQMSAALSVRLALLKKLSTLNIAFFDEPTQNMDELRRTNLAEQIRRVRGFDQLIVISHDDTFEQGLDSLVRLTKEHGETRLLASEDEAEPLHALSVAMSAQFQFQSL